MQPLIRQYFRYLSSALKSWFNDSLGYLKLRKAMPNIQRNLKYYIKKNQYNNFIRQKDYTQLNLFKKKCLLNLNLSNETLDFLFIVYLNKIFFNNIFRFLK